MSEEKKEEVLDQARALDEQELSDAAGGEICVCVVAGGGTADQAGEKTCGCVIGGGGNWNKEGVERAGHRERCMCLSGGYGDSREDMEKSFEERGWYERWDNHLF